MNKTFKPLVNAAVTASLLALASAAFAQSAGDSLEQGFKNPPDSAKPRVWWHWTGGNVTKEGITKDLEWMKRVGIGGADRHRNAVGKGKDPFGGAARHAQHRFRAGRRRRARCMSMAAFTAIRPSQLRTLPPRNDSRFR